MEATIREEITAIKEKEILSEVKVFKLKDVIRDIKLGNKQGFLSVLELDSIDKKLKNSLRFEELNSAGFIKNIPTLWMGYKGTITKLHNDGYEHSILVQILGKKEVYLIPPEFTEFLSPTNSIWGEDYSKFSIEKYVDSQDINCNIMLYRTILSAGDVLFIPSKWWHQVTQLKPSISVNQFLTTKEAIIKEILSRLVRWDFSARDYFKYGRLFKRAD